MAYHGQGPVTVLACRQCGRALVERDPDTDEVTVHGDLSEAPDKVNPLHEVNPYEVTCSTCGAVTEYDGSAPLPDTGGPSAGTGGRAGRAPRRADGAPRPAGGAPSRPTTPRTATAPPPPTRPPRPSSPPPPPPRPTPPSAPSDTAGRPRPAGGPAGGGTEDYEPREDFKSRARRHLSEPVNAALLLLALVVAVILGTFAVVALFA